MRRAPALKRTLAGVVVVLSLTACGQTEPFKEGQAAYRSGDFVTALRLWEPLAEEGDAAAQYNLGFMYRQGHGVAQNDAEAAKWYRLAAEQGDVHAQEKLGEIYRRGYGVRQDHAEAAKWFRLAAEQGLASAQKTLGFMYANGEGLPQDHTEATKWYRRAAEQERQPLR